MRYSNGVGFADGGALVGNWIVLRGRTSAASGPRFWSKVGAIEAAVLPGAALASVSETSARNAGTGFWSSGLRRNASDVIVRGVPRKPSWIWSRRTVRRSGWPNGKPVSRVPLV
ncbi:MAG: hypothetical protein O3B85_02430 [Planctomycetota bacterium]|nr:hypothetical protein [Planctomycetota bacterium]